MDYNGLMASAQPQPQGFSWDRLAQLAQSAFGISPAGAAELPRDPYADNPFRVRGEIGGSGGGTALTPKTTPMQGEVISPSRVPSTTIRSDAAERLGVPNWSDVHGGLRGNSRMTVSERVQRDSLGPMWPQLEEMGVPYDKMMRMNPKDAYQYLKNKTINVGPSAPVADSSESALQAIIRAMGGQ